MELPQLTPSVDIPTRLVQESPVAFMSEGAGLLRDSAMHQGIILQGLDSPGTLSLTTQGIIGRHQLQEGYLKFH